MAKLYHPDATSCSIDGKVYKPGLDGSFELPEEAAAALYSHGFTTDQPALPPPPAPPEKPKKGK